MVRIVAIPIFCAALAAIGVNAVTIPAQAAVNISTHATQNMSCANGVCTPTAKTAYLNVGDLANMLAAGHVKVVTGAGAATIGVEAPLTWTSGHRLTLDAYYSIHFKAQVTVAGRGGVILITNDGGSGGDLSFVEFGGSLTFWDLHSRLVINGQTFTLVNSVSMLANDIAASPSGNFALANNYDAGPDGTYGLSPVSMSFGGTFEGLGNGVQDLAIEGRNVCAGLFAQLSAGGIIRDIRIAASVSSKGGVKSGTLVGCDEGGDILNASAVGDVRGTNHAILGGLVGVISGGTVENSSAMVSVIAEGRDGRNQLNLIGGLAGASNGAVIGSNAAGPVSGGNGSAVGGLVGLNDGTISYSYATGAVTTGNRYRYRDAWAGGLVGYGGNISHSHATGRVSGGEGRMLEEGTAYVYVGGLTGFGDNITQSYASGSVSAGEVARIGGLAGSGGNISQSYATGSVAGGGVSDVGGFVGFTDGDVTQSFSTGAVSGDPYSIGGFIGESDSDNLVQDYWDTDTSGTSRPCGLGSCSGVTGLTDAQLKSGLPAGFDPSVWGQRARINNGYPYLLANPPPK